MGVAAGLRLGFAAARLVSMGEVRRKRSRAFSSLALEEAFPSLSRSPAQLAKEGLALGSICRWMKCFYHLYHFCYA